MTSEATTTSHLLSLARVLTNENRCELKRAQRVSCTLGDCPELGLQGKNKQRQAQSNKVELDCEKLSVLWKRAEGDG
jgi:hypothetical protein